MKADLPDFRYYHDTLVGSIVLEGPDSREFGE